MLLYYDEHLTELIKVFRQLKQEYKLYNYNAIKTKGNLNISSVYYQYLYFFKPLYNCVSQNPLHENILPNDLQTIAIENVEKQNPYYFNSKKNPHINNIINDTISIYGDYLLIPQTTITDEKELIESGLSIHQVTLSPYNENQPLTVSYIAPSFSLTVYNNNTISKSVYLHSSHPVELVSSLLLLILAGITYKNNPFILNRI